MFCLIIATHGLSMLTQAYNYSTEEAESGGLPLIQCQPGLQSETVLPKETDSFFIGR